jgi:hypothetical protein
MADAGDNHLDVETGGADRDFGVTDISSESYLEKMKNSCIGVCFGFLLFFGAMGLMVWNEGRAVAREKDLEEGQEVVVAIRLDDFNRTTVKSGLVHVTAALTTPSVLRDDIFGIATGSADDDDSFTGNGSTPEYFDPALRLKREVQMYQWQEKSSSKQVTTVGGGTRTETSYSYEKVWSSEKYDSSSFNNHNDSIMNPNEWPFEYQEWEASEVFLGKELQLSPTVIDRLIWYEPIDNIDIESIPDVQLQQKVAKENAYSLYYKSSVNASSLNPQIGDSKIWWEVVKPQTISIIADLENGQLSSFVTSRGGSLLLVRPGEYTSDEMFQQAHNENTQLAWILRVVGFLCMFVSILLILQPLSTALDIIPFIGDCLGDGLERCVFPCIAFTVAFPISLFVISLAWLAYRPAFSIPLFVGCGAILCCLVVRARRTKKPGKPDPTYQQEQPAKPAFSANGTAGETYGGSSSYQPHHPQVHGSYDDPPPFSQALQNPPPSAPYQSGEPTFAMPAPYVPQVYKP